MYPTEAKMKPKPRRVRPLLLVLLWMWAGCIALVLDLFLNIAEFEEVRPRAPLYRGARIAAHDLVGEPIVDEPGAPPTRTRAGPLAPVPDEAMEHAGLETRVAGPEDPRIRAAILRALVRSSPDAARRAAQSRLDDRCETDTVRAAATRVLERIGDPSAAH